MATSKIDYGFPMLYESDYTKFATQGQGVTFNNMYVWRVERNLYYFYISVALSQSLASNSSLVIGSLKLPFFGDKPITGIINATQAGQPKLLVIQFLANGDIRLMNISDTAVTDVNGQGFAIRREIYS